MPKSDKQKLKLLYIYKLLWEKSDKDHPIKMKRIIEYLEHRGISAERKSIYDDVSQLNEFGAKVELNKSHKNGGYYLATRDFELAELKMLVDMVQSNRFLTSKKSDELIKKLEKVTNESGAKELQRSVYISGLPKSENETVFELVDHVHRAINHNKGISFLYANYDLEKKLVPRKKGDNNIYRVSPYYLIWNNENYYMVGFDEIDHVVKHYRVDRMLNISLESTDRIGHEEFKNFNIKDYSNAVFGMFGGEKKKINLICENWATNVIIDRFGIDTPIRKYDNGHFSTTVEVVPSQQFYGWLAGIGPSIKINSKQYAQEYIEYLKSIVNTY